MIETINSITLRKNVGNMEIYRKLESFIYSITENVTAINSYEITIKLKLG